MTIYIVLVILIGIIGCLLHPKQSDKRRKTFIVLAFLLLAIVSGWRGYTVGADTKGYVRIFLNAFWLPIINSRYEPGFVVYNRLLRLLSDNPRIVLIVSSTICIGATCIFTQRLSKDPSLSILLYIMMGPYFSQMNMMRQSIALSLTEIAFLLIIQNNSSLYKKVLSGSFLLLASTIHTGAVLAFLPFGLMLAVKSNTRITARRVIRISLICAAVCFGLYSLLAYLVGALFPQYNHYFSGVWSDSNYNASFFNTLVYIAFAAEGVIAFKGKRLNRTQFFGAIELGFAIIVSVLSMRMEIWSRISGVFGIYTYMLWAPEALSHHEYNNRAIHKMLIIMFAFAYMIIVLKFRPEWSLVVPYVWNNGSLF